MAVSLLPLESLRFVRNERQRISMLTLWHSMSKLPSYFQALCGRQVGGSCDAVSKLFLADATVFGMTWF